MKQILAIKKKELIEPQISIVNCSKYTQKGDK